MNQNATTESNCSPSIELPTASPNSTQSFLETCVLNADHKTLEQHLASHTVQQSDLDECLLRGLRIVQEKERELSQLAQVLTVLLKSGAKWICDALLDEQKTPYHIICESPGDHHKLLNLMIKSSQGKIIDTHDIFKHTALMHAAQNKNINCVKKLIEKGARFDVIGYNKRYVWSMIVSIGNIELLKLLFNHGIDKDCTDENGISILWYVVDSGNVEAVRYLLDLGVVIPTYALDVRETQCEQCKENTLIIEWEGKWKDQLNHDPCMKAIRDNKFEIVKLLDEHGCQSSKSFNALMRAVIYHRLEIASYLLDKYAYPLNIEYIKIAHSSRKQGLTLLTELNLNFIIKLNLVQITTLLLDHGADPAKPMCLTRSPNAIMAAIHYGNLKVIVQYIRSGVNINIRSYDLIHENVLPFESSILRGYHNVAEILLISGCSCEVFSLDNYHEFKNNLKPEVEKLMKDWKVQENNVTPLQLRCRSVILNHLSPRADVKIENLPLPGCVIKFLGISELDVELEA